MKTKVVTKEQIETTDLEINLVNRSKPSYAAESDPPPYPKTYETPNDKVVKPLNLKTDGPPYPIGPTLESSDNTTNEPSLAGGWNTMVLQGREIKHFQTYCSFLLKSFSYTYIKF